MRDDAWHALRADRRWSRTPTRRPRSGTTSRCWAEAQAWISEHPDEFAEGYYVEHEGLTPEDAKYVVDGARAPTRCPTVVGRRRSRAHQETADLLAEEQGHEKLDLADLYDRRFEEAIAGGAS